MERFTILLLCFGALFSLSKVSNAADTLAANESMRDGDTIVSAGGMFELGFFSTGYNSRNNRYLGIWYKKVSNRTVVWIANRDTPLNGTTTTTTTSSGMLQVSSDGILKLLSSSDGGYTIWSSSVVSLRNVSAPVAQLLDNGNLVVRDERSSDKQTFIWQSFDYPTDTLLAGMKLGKDLVSGVDRRLTSWKNVDDPSTGEYTAYMDTNGFPQIFVKQGNKLHSRSGPWNGLRFSGMPEWRVKATALKEFVFNEKEIFYRYKVANSSITSRLYMNTEGDLTRANWVDSTQSWFHILTTVPVDSCSPYGICGPYGTCNANNFPVCSCMGGFEPKHPEKWSVADWSGGCTRRTPLDCGSGDGFRGISGLKFPDTRSSWYNSSMSLGDCEMTCTRNCSCTAYADLDIRNGGSGCLLWFDELMDIREYDEIQNIYVRLAVSELTSLTTPESRSNKKKHIILGVVLASVCLVLLSLAIYAIRKKKRYHMNTQDTINEGEEEDSELPTFSLSKIAKSTSNFSITNKLGEGGFGAVYKGVLDDGREIAVKRLSKTSSQGLDEFKNEIRCIVKLQHRNLVKLLGYCIQGDETMLIYEYMANKSLDLTIYDECQNSILLDWPQRFRIIHGIARGLLYLHQDSRLRVIHRDLKAGNILLDYDMNPKISDFGLARRFVGIETEATTNKVVGTYGYISPEYAVHGLFSVKSDVFSFGVLVLEIVSGKKNRGFCHEEHGGNLLAHAWRLYNEERTLDLASSMIRDMCIESEVLRSIHIGLLCVQQHAEDRPTMSSVVVMLDNESTLPPPKQPAFFAQVRLPENNAISLPPTQNSVDNVTITLVDAR